jgi:plastocyanin
VDAQEHKTTGQNVVLTRGTRCPAYWRRKIFSSLVTTALAVAAATCGGSSGSPPSSGLPAGPTPAPADPPVIRISATGADPKQLIVAAGDRVTFTNNDTQPHDIQGGPDPANPDCREIDAVGFIVPGQSKQTLPLPVVRTCDYHDHQNHAPIFTGRIIIR